MKKILYTLLFALSFFSALYAQNYGNEWINYNQTYYKIKVAQDGIYRLPYQTLVNSGFPADEIDPRRIQIFYEGEEQYIYVHSEGTTGIFDPNGYIEFYGKRNRGYRDVVLWSNPEDCVNPDYSLFSDTSVYFITYNSSLSNRRMLPVSDNNYADYASNLSEYCIKHIRENYTGFYYGASTRCVYTQSEGYLDAAVIKDDVPQLKTIQTPFASTAAPNATIEIAVCGTPGLNLSSNVPHHLKVNFLDSTFIDEIYSGYEFVKKQISLPVSSIPNTINFVFSSNDTQNPALNDNNRVSYIDIHYGHTYNFEGKNSFEFILPSGSGSKDLLSISNFNASGISYLYDLNQHHRILCSENEGVINALVNNSGEDRNMILVSPNAYLSVSDIVPVSSDGKFTDYNTLYTNSDYFIVTNKTLWESAVEYQTYRNTTGYNVALYDFDELVDQYTYGVAKNPLAIRYLVRQFVDNTGEVPKSLFLLGKGIRTAVARNNGNYLNANLVATLGNPASDILITAGINDTHFEPLVATGRLSAKSNQDVRDYLNKVIAYEANPVQEWMKHILHFGGGSNAPEQQQFEGYLTNYKNIIEDTLFGGYVHTFLKNSSAPIQISVSDSVRNLINNGVSMMCFFGHASSSGFDQDIDNPDSYDNQNKYPFILANSCYSGDIFKQFYESTSEDWVIEPERGAIAFLASVGKGIASYLNSFSENLYKNIAYRYYGETLGEQVKQSIKYTQQGNLNSYGIESTCHEMALHGDPAIRINSAELPDLEIRNEDLVFVPEEINTVLDSFNVNLTIRNIGHAFQDSFLVHIERRYPDNSFDEKDIPIFGSIYLDTLLIKFPVDKEKGPGLNRLSVSLDYYNEIEELSETNNNVSIDFLISTSDLFPIYPYEYSIYPNSTVSLKASTGSPFVSELSYLFQMDTTDMFKSLSDAPLYEGQVNASGGIVEWTPPVSLTDNQVYYWRVAAANPNPDSIRWKESSFIYIEGEEGWSQAHFYQFKKDTYQFIKYDRDELDFDYIQTPKQLHVHNQAALWSQTFDDVFWSIDGAFNNGNGNTGCCAPHPAMIIVIIDPVTIKAWSSDTDDFGHRNYPKCFSSNNPEGFFVFSTGTASDFNETAMNGMNDMLLNHVPDGHYVVAYSWRNAVFESWPEEIISTFEGLGSSEVRHLQNNESWIFFVQKGSPATATEKVGNNPNVPIDLYQDLYLAFNYGTITSTLIGPATSWGSLHWLQESIDTPNYDSTYLEVLSYNPATLESTSIDTIFPPLYDVYNLNDSIPASEHPYLKLRMWTRDDTAKTPAQIDKWQLRYKGIPETAINPQAGFYINKDTLNQGDDLMFALATENISTYDMDSLLVKYWIQTSSNSMVNLGTKRLRPHPAGDVIMDTLSLSTLNLSGLNSLWIEYNPMTEGGYYDQKEQYHFNNIAQYFFYVEKDNENPLLDVTFDGIHILDGDIVSAKPNILISLKDENQYLALNDTSLFRVYLDNLITGEQKRVYFRDSLGNEVLKWTAGVMPENKFKIEYTPEFISDGKYQLRIQATDVSGNESGDFDYAISFEVVVESTITNILNYPNPFSTSTRFVFELTGSVIPDEIRIEIYTVTGKLVKVIEQGELGAIHIGRNVTEYAWDGTDMYGDQLANGVYFYRVRTKIMGEDMEHRSNQSDAYFKKEIGKMYLMR